MKATFYLVLCTVLLYACQPNTTIDNNPIEKIPKKIESAQNLSTQKKLLTTDQTEIKPIVAETILPPPKLAKLILDDTTQYSTTFVQELRVNKQVHTLELHQDTMILNQKDTILFPTIPILNRPIVLTARKDDLAIALTVKRINFTSVAYRIEMVEFGKASKVENGIADLGIFFFLGSEANTDSSTKEGYFATQYGNTNNFCYTYLNFGNLTAHPEKPLLAQLIKNCNGKIQDLNLANFTTLREK